MTFKAITILCEDAIHNKLMNFFICKGNFLGKNSAFANKSKKNFSMTIFYIKTQKISKKTSLLFN